MATKVAILGGGVGGLSAAHELVERGFAVTVYESKDLWGGKARSIQKPGTGTDGRKHLPGEHGFRFFPGFYKHVPDTMKRIPVSGGKHVFDNLVGTSEVGLYQELFPRIVLPANFPTTLKEWEAAIRDLIRADPNIPLDEIEFFLARLLQILTSCQERRVAEYEAIDWWDFIDAPNKSIQFQKFFGKGLTRSLVALRAEEASTRTVGDILLQLILFMLMPGVPDDRVLNGPTNDVWIDPWVAYLKSRGVEMHLSAPTLQLKCDGQRLSAATVQFNGTPADIQADYYVCAFPVEVMTRLLTDDLKKASPALARVPLLKTEWMNGVQFFLAKDVPFVKGHAVYLDSAWALTSISQPQFWSAIDMAGYGAGNVRGILSIDISNWTVPGTKAVQKPAQECSEAEIVREVWEQVKAHVNREGMILLEDTDLIDHILDPDITFPRNHPDNNAEPLLVNTISSWQNRPGAALEIPNLLLASDYVQTNTDLATMEGANEAARRAVNAILEKTGSTAPPCQIWPFHEPDIFRPLRDYDWLRFKLGLPHSSGPLLIVGLSIGIILIFLVAVVLGVASALAGSYGLAVVGGVVALACAAVGWFTVPILFRLWSAGHLFHTPGKS